MKNLLLITTLILAVTPALAAEFTTSEAGETKLEGSEATPVDGSGVAATGHVVSVDADKHTIKIKHDPIKALGWPAMSMNFTADRSVDLSGVQAGDAVSFTLTPRGKDDYTISAIKK